MKAQGRGTTRARLPIAKLLVVGQIALSLILVVTAGLLLGSFRRLMTKDIGFQAEGVLLAKVELANTGMDSTRRALSRAQLLEKVRAIPGVRTAALSYVTPVSGSGWNDVIAAGKDSTGDQQENLAWFNSVSSGWFTTMGTALLAGRDFGPGDNSASPRVAIVSDAVARHYFPGESPLGRTVRVRGPKGLEPPFEIVGVVANVAYDDLAEESPRTVYLSMHQGPWYGTRATYVMRTEGDPNALMAQFTEAALSESRAAGLEYATLKTQVRESVTRPRLLATLSGFFGGLALLLSIIGLYGTMAYGVAQRRSEIGIRLALGAARERVLSMVLGEAGVLVIGGAALGLAAAFLATKLVATFLYGVTRNDPWTLGGSVLVLAVVGLAAGAIPAWRAASVDPAETLRNE